MLENGSLISIFCFSCGLKKVNVKNEKDFKSKIKKYIDNENKCKSCGSSRIYVRDGDGNVIKIEHN